MSDLPPDRLYLDDDPVIKAIEKCSLQGMFGPEITSTRALLSKESEGSSTTTSRASYDSGADPVEPRDLFDEDPHSPYNSTDLLAIEEADKGGDIPSKRTSDESGIAVGLAKQESNIFSDHTTNNGSYPVLPGHEDGTTSFSQSDYFGRVHQEKASYHKYTPLFSLAFLTSVLMLGRRDPPIDRHAENPPQCPRLILLKLQASKP